MRDTEVVRSRVSTYSNGLRMTVKSSVIDEAREVGGRVYYPHALTTLGRGGDFQMRLKAVDVAAVTVGILEYSTPVRIQTGALKDAYQINFPLHGHLKMTYGPQQILASPTVAAIHGFELPTGLEGWDRPARMLGLKVPKRLIDQELAVLLDRTPEAPVEFAGSLELGSRRAQEWRSAVELLTYGLRNRDSLLGNPLVSLPAVQSVVRGLLLVAPNNFTAELTGDSAAIDSTAVRQAMEFIDANAALPISLEDIAASARVSPRSLQLGFRTHIRSTPMAVLRGVRLQRTREDLLAAVPTDKVSEVAARWGFTHAGRFAIQYAKTFGESPSETLKKSTKYR
jgi:AraC-like DNA-binding protein